jgi:hypothetical protein
MRPRINPDKDYFTPEAARLVGRSPRSLETWRRCGTYPLLVWRRVKHKIVYRGTDLLKFLSSKDPVGNDQCANAPLATLPRKSSVAPKAKRRRGVR